MEKVVKMTYNSIVGYGKGIECAVKYHYIDRRAAIEYLIRRIHFVLLSGSRKRSSLCSVL